MSWYITHYTGGLTDVKFYKKGIKLGKEKCAITVAHLDFQRGLAYPNRVECGHFLGSVRTGQLTKGQVWVWF